MKATPTRRGFLAGAAAGAAAAAAGPASPAATAADAARRPLPGHAGRPSAAAGRSRPAATARRSWSRTTGGPRSPSTRRGRRGRTSSTWAASRWRSPSPPTVAAAVTTAFCEKPGLVIVDLRAGTVAKRVDVGPAHRSASPSPRAARSCSSAAASRRAHRRSSTPRPRRDRRAPRSASCRASWSPSRAAPAPGWPSTREDQIVRVHLRTGRISRTHETPWLPDRLALAPDGKRILVMPRQARRRPRQRDRDAAAAACATSTRAALPSARRPGRPASGGSSRWPGPARSSSSARRQAHRRARRRRPARTRDRGRAGVDRRCAHRQTSRESAMSPNPPTGEFLRGAARVAATTGIASLGGGLAATGRRRRGARGPTAQRPAPDDRPGAPSGPSARRPPDAGALLAGRERHAHRPLPRVVDGLLALTRDVLDRHVRPQQGIYGTFVVGTQFTMDPSIPTIGDLFKEVGYRTAFFGKWHLSFPGDPPTNARGRARHRPEQPARRLRVRRLRDLAALGRRRLQRRLHERSGLDRAGPDVAPAPTPRTSSRGSAC